MQYDWHTLKYAMHRLIQSALTECGLFHGLNFWPTLYCWLVSFVESCPCMKLYTLSLLSLKSWGPFSQCSHLNHQSDVTLELAANWLTTENVVLAISYCTCAYTSLFVPYHNVISHWSLCSIVISPDSCFAVLTSLI